MRSAALLALLALAACKPAEQPAPPPGAESQASPSASPTPTGSPGPASRSEPTATASPLPARMQALGTEPFWSIEIAPEGLRYSDPENIAGTAFAATAVSAEGGRRWSGTLAGEPLVLLVVPGTCSDGMSDTVYPFTATLVRAGRTLNGCARKR